MWLANHLGDGGGRGDLMDPGYGRTYYNDDLNNTDAQTMARNE